MKTFSARCCCGSSVELRDDAETLINAKTGEADKQGRKYLIELRSQEWLDRHQKCVDAKVAQQAQKQ